MSHRYHVLGPIMLGSLLVACAVGSAGIQIEDSWARPALKGENSAIYFQITSHAHDDMLLLANTDVAMKTELHRSIMSEDGTMKMEHQDQIELPINELVELIPGGIHVMLMGLTENLNPGDHIRLNLVFEHNDEITIDVPIKNP